MVKRKLTALNTVMQSVRVLRKPRRRGIEFVVLLANLTVVEYVGVV